MLLHFNIESEIRQKKSTNILYILLKNIKKGLNFHKNRNSALEMKEKIYVFPKNPETKVFEFLS